jgi:HSP20 family protein
MFALFVFVSSTEMETKRTTIELKSLKPSAEAKNQILKADEKILIEPLQQNLENPTEKEKLVPVEESVSKNQDETEANEGQDEQSFDDNFWNDSWSPDSFFDEKEKSDSKFDPDTNIYESEEKFIILTELPGVERKDIHIKYERGDQDFLTISGEKIKPNLGNIIHDDIDFGKFEQRFKLKHILDIKATFENGILKIVLQRKPQEPPKIVEVKIE